MQIWKWPLVLADRQVIEVPAGARLLAVQVQRGSPQVWALCDPEKPKEPRGLAMYGTGHPVPADPGRYLGTFQIDGGQFVFHVFEVTSAP